MGFWSSLGGFVSSVGRAVASTVSAAVGAVRSVGGALIKTAKAAVERVASKVQSLEKLLIETAKGAVKGGLAGFARGGWWGALAGAAKGGAYAGYQEYRRQSRSSREQELMAMPLEQAAHELSGAEAVDILGEMIGNFLPVLKQKVSSNQPVESFDEFLRLDVSMRFMLDLVSKLKENPDTSQLSQDDRKFIILINKLVLDAELNDAELQEFDRLVKKSYGRSLLIMGSERVFALWTEEEVSARARMYEAKDLMGRDQMFVDKMEGRQRHGHALSANEIQDVAAAKAAIGRLKESLDRDSAYHRNLRLLTGVAEGLVQYAEAQERGEQMRERVRNRHDRAGAILINQERAIDEIRYKGQLAMSQEEREFIDNYVDLHMADANQRKHNLENEYQDGLEIKL